MRLRFLAAPTALRAAAVTAVSALPAQADHSWGGYHWARSGAVTAPLVSSLTSDWVTPSP